MESQRTTYDLILIIYEFVNIVQIQIIHIVNACSFYYTLVIELQQTREPLRNCIYFRSRGVESQEWECIRFIIRYGDV